MRIDRGRSCGLIIPPGDDIVVVLPGDILLAYRGSKNHTCMYIGGGKIAEASSAYGAWSRNSIAVRSLSNRTYGWYDAVLRYRGK